MCGMSTCECGYVLRTCTSPLSFGSQWKLQVSNDSMFSATRDKMMVKRTVMGKRLRFLFTMFSTSALAIAHASHPLPPIT